MPSAWPPGRDPVHRLADVNVVERRLREVHGDVVHPVRGVPRCRYFRLLAFTVYSRNTFGEGRCIRVVVLPSTDLVVDVVDVGVDELEAIGVALRALRLSVLAL